LSEPITVKRYANRKLYDQSRSRYVTLEDLEELIRQGREIRVVDAVSGQDLTSLTLAQIILDNARGGRAVLPASFLHQLIKHGEAWQELFRETLAASLSGIVESQREAERALREWGRRTGWWAEEAVPAGEAAGGRGSADLRAEVADLKARLRELESRLTQPRTPEPEDGGEVAGPPRRGAGRARPAVPRTG
jgi:polyhydroxyalkanoate synthesis repressor PhaR